MLDPDVNNDSPRCVGCVLRCRCDEHPIDDAPACTVVLASIAFSLLALLIGF